MFRKEKGFTLIELLIVIAVIGILAAAILPRFIAFDTSAKAGSTQGSLSSLRAALVLYRAEKGYYPTTLASITPTYIDKVPTERINDSSAEENAANELAFTTWGTAGGWVYGNYDPATNWGRSIKCNFTGSYDADGDGLEAHEYYTNY